MNTVARPLPSIPAKVPRLNRQRTFSLGRGNACSCPKSRHPSLIRGSSGWSGRGSSSDPTFCNRAISGVGSEEARSITLALASVRRSGRRAWLFAGSDRGGERAAAMYTLIATAKLNRVDPQAWLADVLRRIADHPASGLNELLPWHWKHRETPAAAA